MASNINTGNVDATYPKAGQDNDSQGFRDNFNAIKNNLQHAKDEIETLQTGKASTTSASDFLYTCSVILNTLRHKGALSWLSLLPRYSNSR